MYTNSFSKKLDLLDTACRDRMRSRSLDSIGKLSISPVEVSSFHPPNDNREVSYTDEYGYGYEYVITFCAPCDVKRFYTRFHTRMQRISAVIRLSKKTDIIFVDFTADFYVYLTNILPFYSLELSSTNADWNLWDVPEKIKEKMDWKWASMLSVETVGIRRANRHRLRNTKGRMSWRERIRLSYPYPYPYS